MRRILFVLGWLLVLALAQISLNPTIGLLAVVACAVHIGLVLSRRGQPNTAHLDLTGVLWLARRVVIAPLWLPVRLLRSRQQPSQAETIGIEVHTADRRRAANIERLLRATLWQCARTWAPHPLPIDRIAVHAGAPPAGRAQVYEYWLPTQDPKHRSSASLAVISLSLLNANGRPLDDQQLAGALATQIAALIGERYQRELADVPATDPVATTMLPRLIRLPAAELVDTPRPDDELGVLMDRLRRQASPLEPDSASASNTND